MMAPEKALPGTLGRSTTAGTAAAAPNGRDGAGVLMLLKLVSGKLPRRSATGESEKARLCVVVVLVVGIGGCIRVGIGSEVWMIVGVGIGVGSGSGAWVVVGVGSEPKR